MWSLLRQRQGPRQAPGARPAGARQLDGPSSQGLRGGEGTRPSPPTAGPNARQVLGTATCSAIVKRYIIRLHPSSLHSALLWLIHGSSCIPPLGITSPAPLTFFSLPWNLAEPTRPLSFLPTQSTALVRSRPTARIWPRLPRLHFTHSLHNNQPSR